MDPLLCPDAKKITNFRPYFQYEHFSVQTLNFVLKSPQLKQLCIKTK